MTFGFSAAGGWADSIWNENGSSPYSTQKAYKVGDIVNVIILESSTAKNLAGTKTDVKDDLAAKFSHTLQRLAPVIGSSNQAAGQLSNKYAGSGQTTRGSNVSARITAWVTEILSNGNLVIRGEHRVEVNDELQEIIFTGIVRPKDITAANAIYSYQVAKADLSIKGSGAVADSESPGWITRILNWLF
ncbi:flagellar basal body L-ring protein FlgH [Candidatus Saganbacteria bacterium]|uniref:Flagellar basal body L-ring protein FlgH n=1 Tax=Candidatus Saganbacteria bacterium TaxID=2575572 RepID=A0A9D6UML7_UNCSA|nr:flagellar basal body L-ring protein FlgH [Candidatus Saganbacteria bacterium]